MLMKQLVIFLLGVAVSFTSFSQKEKAINYINKYKDVAIEEMKRSGVPASITLAQGMLESGYGESDLCVKSNNHFGIKCKNEWTGDKVYHDDDEKGECFRAYPTASDSYKDHSEFLKSRPWYAFLFKLDATDYEGWAKGLKKAGYATERDYPQRLINMINDYSLQQYTLAALAKQKEETVVTSVTETTTSTAKDTTATVKEEVEPIDTETVINQPKQVLSDTTVKKTSKYPEGIFTINHAQAIYAKEGTSLLSLANKFGISLRTLLDYNDLDEMDLIDIDRIIFIEKKIKKGAKDFYIVEAKESLHDICQSEGVQLSYLLMYNKLKQTSTLKKGDKVYLRPVATTTKLK
jgi:hypothetical protein